jgi:hypothetical protein
MRLRKLALVSGVALARSSSLLVHGFSTFGVVPHKTSIIRAKNFRPTNGLRDFPSSTSLSLSSSLLQADASIVSSITDALASDAAFWTAAIMLSIVALLSAWEKSVKSARKALSPTLMPVVDSMLADLGGLGFVGIFLSVFVTGGLVGDVIEFLGEKYFDDGEILIETFEFMHTAFFEVGIGFFLVAGLTVAKVLRKIQSLTEVTTAAFAGCDCNGAVSLDALADALQVPTMEVDLDCDGDLTKEELSQALIENAKLLKTNYWDEATMNACDVRAEALVLRAQFITKLKLPQTFSMDKYYETVLGSNLKEMVELSPLTWLPLVPPISIARSVDMSRDIVSAASPNAALSCGYFIGTSGSLISHSAGAIIGLSWGLWNFWKMTSIKDMLLPTLVRDSKGGDEAILLPPRYEVDELFQKFNSSPGIFGKIESFFGKPARNRHEELFGAAGAAGPELYRNSIKFQMWLAVSQVLLWGGQIVFRDMAAIVRGSEVGNPDLLYPELALFGLYVALAAAQLWLVPQTFLNYCLATSIESLTDKDIVYEVCEDKDYHIEISNSLFVGSKE